MKSDANKHSQFDDLIRGGYGV